MSDFKPNMWLNGNLKKYDKLIRDKIPGIIESKGKQCKVEVMDDEEFALYLKKKLQEEVDEFLESGEVDELVDVLEVMRAILELEGVTVGEFEEMRREKAAERGGFEKRLKLLGVWGE